MTFLDVSVSMVFYKSLMVLSCTIETYKIKNKLTDIEYDVQFYADAVKNIREKILNMRRRIISLIC